MVSSAKRILKEQAAERRMIMRRYRLDCGFDHTLVGE
jgi:hypothetical protein